MKYCVALALILFSLAVSAEGPSAPPIETPGEESDSPEKAAKGWVDLTDQGADEDTAAPPSPEEDDFTPKPEDSPAP